MVWYLVTEGLGQNTSLYPTFKNQAAQEDFHFECLPLENGADGAGETPITINKLEHATFCKCANLKYSILHSMTSY